MLLAQLSDLHLDGGSVAHGRVVSVVEFLCGLARLPDAVLVTGDLANSGSPAEYAEAAEIFSVLPVPAAFLPGNHDGREAFRDFLAPRGITEITGTADEPLNQLWRLEGAVLALCDTTIPGAPGGYLADGTRDWLAQVVSDTPQGTPLLIG